jgi:hypothetical protein
MDEATLHKCENRIGTAEVKPTLTSEFVTQYLNHEEQLLWEKCAEYHIRLEQEHIPSDIAFPVLRNHRFRFIDT